MKQGSWTTTFFDKERVGRTNHRLLEALTHCPTLESSGWSFRCTEAHVAEGSYPAGDGRNWHFHREYQIEVAVEGEFEFVAQSGRKVRLVPGCALVIPWNLTHRWKCLRKGVMLGLSLQLLPTPRSIRAEGRLISRITAVPSPAARVEALLEGALSTVPPGLRAKLLASHLFVLLAGIMEPLFPREEEPAPERQAADIRGKEIVGRLVRRLEENIALPLDGAARELGVSPRHLHRLFVRHLGKSLHDYALEYRLERARQFLTQPGNKMLVKEIAFACGFRSLTTFSTSFRSVFGLSPSAILMESAAIKPRFTNIILPSPGQASGRTEKPRKSVSASATRRARG